MEKHLKISKNFTFSFLFLSFDSSKSVYFEEEIFDESHLNMAEHTIITVSIRIRTLSKKKILRRKKKKSVLGGWKLRLAGHVAVVDPRVGTTDKEEGEEEEEERGLVCARDRTKGGGEERCNGTIRAGLTGKADVRPPAKSLFPGERRVSTLFSFQIKPLPFIPPSFLSPSPSPLSTPSPFPVLESFNDEQKKKRLRYSALVLPDFSLFLCFHSLSLSLSLKGK